MSFHAAYDAAAIHGSASTSPMPDRREADQQQRERVAREQRERRNVAARTRAHDSAKARRMRSPSNSAAIGTNVTGSDASTPAA